MTKTIRFEPGRVYEVTGIWVTAENLPELGAYFQKIFPLAAAEFGVEPLFSLEPRRAHAGEFMPQMMFVNEWPSLESFQRFVDDPRAKALFPERDAVVERLVVTHYEVPRSTEVTLREGDVVEMAAMWIGAGNEDALSSYYQTVFPIALDHGLRPMTPLSPVYSYKGDFVPHRAGLNLWGSLTNFDAFADSAQEHFPKRDAALSHLVVTHAAVRFEGEG